MAWQSRFCGNVSCLRVLSLLAGCGTMVGASFIFAFGAYANGLKVKYDLTQSQVDLLLSLFNFAICGGLFQGFLQSKVGVFWNNVITLAMVTVTSLLIWSTTISTTIEFYHSHFYLLAIIYFLFGLSVALAYMAAISVNMGNFANDNSGRITGIVFTAFYLGCFLSNQIFSSFYDNPDKPGDSNLGGFFVLQAVFNIVVNAIAVLLLNSYDTNEESSHLLDSNLNFSSEDPEGKNSVAEDVNVTGLQLLKSPDFHLVTWTFVLLSGYALVVKTNVLTYALSFNLDYHRFTILNSVNYLLAGSASLAFGFLSDALLTWTPRCTYLLITCALTAILLLTAMFFMSNQAFLIAFVTFSVFGEGVAWGLTPPILSDLIGQKYFSWNWGLTMLLAGVYGFLSLFVSSSVYDAEGPRNSPFCHGLHCYKMSDLYFFFSLLACVVMTSVLLWRDSIRKSRSLSRDQTVNGHANNFEDAVMSYEQL